MSYVKWIMIGLFASVLLSGCSLAVDTQQDISIPVRKDGFEINAPSTERLKDVVDEYKPSF